MTEKVVMEATSFILLCGSCDSAPVEHEQIKAECPARHDAVWERAETARGEQ